VIEEVECRNLGVAQLNVAGLVNESGGYGLKELAFEERLNGGTSAEGKKVAGVSARGYGEFLGRVRGLARCHANGKCWVWSWVDWEGLSCLRDGRGTVQPRLQCQGGHWFLILTCFQWRGRLRRPPGGGGGGRHIRDVRWRR
jgi:hypothetical protein